MEFFKNVLSALSPFKAAEPEEEAAPAPAPKNGKKKRRAARYACGGTARSRRRDVATRRGRGGSFRPQVLRKRFRSSRTATSIGTRRFAAPPRDVHEAEAPSLPRCGSGPAAARSHRCGSTTAIETSPTGRGDAAPATRRPTAAPRRPSHDRAPSEPRKREPAVDDALRRPAAKAPAKKKTVAKKVATPKKKPAKKAASPEPRASKPRRSKRQAANKK